jgi:hypothetical protein
VHYAGIDWQELARKGCLARAVRAGDHNATWPNDSFRFTSHRAKILRRLTKREG